MRANWQRMPVLLRLLVLKSLVFGGVMAFAIVAPLTGHSIEGFYRLDGESVSYTTWWLSRDGLFLGAGGLLEAGAAFLMLSRVAYARLWYVTVFGVVALGSIFSNERPLYALVVNTSLTALLAAYLYGRRPVKVYFEGDSSS